VQGNCPRAAAPLALGAALLDSISSHSGCCSLRFDGDARLKGTSGVGCTLSPTTVGVGYKLDETREDCCASLILSKRFAYTSWLKPGASGSQNLVFKPRSHYLEGEDEGDLGVC